MRTKGTGSISEKGYMRIFVWNPAKGRKRLRMEHQVVWEQANGAVPQGYDIHHRDENKLNNALSNLELVKHGEHKRLHIGGYIVDGIWMRKCAGCELEITCDSARKARCRACYNEDHKNYMTRTGRTNKFQYIVIRDVKGRIITRERLVA